MLHSIRNRSSLQVFCAFLALYILNCSIDTSELHSFGTPTDVTINHQESVAELIIEKVLGFENAIAENDDSGTENQSTLKKLTAVDFYLVPQFSVDVADFLTTQLLTKIGFSAAAQRQTYFEIHSPPPEV